MFVFCPTYALCSSILIQLVASGLFLGVIDVKHLLWSIWSSLIHIFYNYHIFLFPGIKVCIEGSSNCMDWNLKLSTRNDWKDFPTPKGADGLLCDLP